MGVTGRVRVPCPLDASMNWVPTVADLSEGGHDMHVWVVDAAGNTTHVPRTVYVDNTPPDPIVPNLAGGTGWRRVNGFSVSWSNPHNSGAPITRAHWKLCRSDGGCPATGTQRGQGVDELPQIFAPSPGEYRLSVWLEDAAGNHREANAALSVPVRWDPEPPELAFLAPDPADPLRVAVRAADRHSGIADGEIEMRASGASTWHALRTRPAGRRPRCLRGRRKIQARLV